jgi:hypothetical protein
MEVALEAALGVGWAEVVTVAAMAAVAMAGVRAAS